MVWFLSAIYDIVWTWQNWTEVIHHLCASMVGSTASAALTVACFRSSIWYYTVFHQLLFNTRLDWTTLNKRSAGQNLIGLRSNQVAGFYIISSKCHTMEYSKWDSNWDDSFAKIRGYSWCPNCFADHHTGAVLMDLNHCSQCVEQGLWEQNLKTAESRQCNKLYVYESSEHDGFCSTDSTGYFSSRLQ